MVVVINQYEVFLIGLDPTKGHEIRKTGPCVVVSPNEMNSTIGTVIIAPITTKSHAYPTCVELEFKDKKCWIVLDQIRTVDRSRLIKNVGRIRDDEVLKLKAILREMLVD